MTTKSKCVRAWMRQMLLALVLVFLGGGCGNNQQPLSHDVYVWQRVWQTAVVSAIDSISPYVGRFAVLAAEIEFSAGVPKATLIQLDYAGLQKTARPVVLCIRIGAWGGPFDPRQKTTAFVLQTLEKALAQARLGGVQPVELQIDFDCADTDLAGYRTLIKHIHNSSGGLRLSFTALPSWLKQPDFAGLVQEADSFVLQVHSLQKSNRHPSGYTLCDADAALAWVEAANTLKKPFSVALPTYGYRLVADTSGRIVDVLAEEPAGNTFGDGNGILVVSQPKDMTLLVRQWTNKRPQYLATIIWYRLPVATDQFNWPMPALLAVMSGRVPITDLQVNLQTPEPGLTEIWLENSGESIIYQARVAADFEISKLLAVDVTRGFSLQKTDQGIVFATSAAGEGGLRPAERVNIGWLRLEENQTVSVTAREGI